MTEPAPPAKRRGKLPFSVSRINILGIVAIVVAASLLAVHNLHHDNSPNQILNVSYDPTRELYAAIDKTFVDEFRKKTGVTVEVKQSHGGSGRQAAEVIKGHEKADVVSLGARAPSLPPPSVGIVGVAVAGDGPLCAGCSRQP